MHWRRRAREEQQAYLLSLHREQLEQSKLQHQQQMEAMRQFLLSAMGPLATALQRQDNLLLEKHSQQMELLGEILNSLQPSVRQQLGLPSRPQSSLNSGT